MRKWIWLVSATAWTIGLSWQGGAHAAILINEVLADPSTVSGDANGDGIVQTSQDEFIELVNTTTTSVSLAGWSLSDLVGLRHTFSASSAIPGLGFFVVFGGGSPQGILHVAVASSGGLSLNNSGDTVTLRDGQMVSIDAFAYGAEGGMDVSLTRAPDAVGSFVKHTSVAGTPFSPGSTFDSRTTLSLPARTTSIPEPSSLIFVFGGMVGPWLIRRRGRAA